MARRARPRRRRRCRAAQLVAGVLAFLPACATVTLNQPLSRFDPADGYRFANLSAPSNSDEVFVVLTFSGGGTRAAALAYGVLAELRDTSILVNGERRTLLDEVDVISSVSGGSFTAAYYALFGDGLFDSFEDRFLLHDVQGDLVRETLGLGNLLRLSSADFARSDLAVEYYDRRVFARKTYRDLIERGRRPFVIINAADMTLGTSFEFTQDQFDLIYSDLSSEPIARAVAASSAFPILLTPITLRNYADQPGYTPPPWVLEALDDPEASSRRLQKAVEARSYADTAHRPYVHLIDGGVADNLGVRAVLHSLLTTDSPWSLLRMMNLERVERIVVIMVNAATEPDTTWDSRRAVPNALEVASATLSGLLDNYTFDSVVLLEEQIERMRQDARARDECERLLLERDCADTTLPGGGLQPVEFHPVHVSFQSIADPSERRYFQNLPTSFVLPPKDVHALIRVGRRLLRENPEFAELRAALKGR